MYAHESEREDRDTGCEIVGVCACCVYRLEDNFLDFSPFPISSGDHQVGQRILYVLSHRPGLFLFVVLFLVLVCV